MPLLLICAKFVGTLYKNIFYYTFCHIYYYNRFCKIRKW